MQSSILYRFIVSSTHGLAVCFDSRDEVLQAIQGEPNINGTLLLFQNNTRSSIFLDTLCQDESHVMSLELFWFFDPKWYHIDNPALESYTEGSLCSFCQLSQCLQINFTLIFLLYWGVSGALPLLEAFFGYFRLLLLCKVKSGGKPDARFCREFSPLSNWYSHHPG